MKSNRIIPLLLIIGLTLTGLWFLTYNKKTPAPDVTFITITGEKITLNSLKGKPVIITFWATDCASCIKEMPDLINLYNQFHPQGLEIIAVTMYYDIPSHVVEMTKAKQLPYPIALDLKAKHAQAFGHVELTPSTFLISPSGLIVMQKTGLFDVAEMEQKIKQLIKG